LEEYYVKNVYLYNPIEDNFIFNEQMSEKILICLLTSCSIQNETSPNTQVDPSYESTESIVYGEVPEGTPSDEFTDYASIIEEYRRFASYAIEFYGDNEYYVQVDDRNLWYNRGWLGGLIVDFYLGRKLTKDDFSYAIQDLNGNSSSELILIMGEQVVRAIFSMVDEKPKLLDEFWPRHYGEIDSSGILYTRGSSGADYTTWASYQISQNDDELVLIDEFGTDEHDMDTLETNYYKMVNGIKQRITSEEFNELYERFFNVSHSTKNSGIEFIPLFD